MDFNKLAEMSYKLNYFFLTFLSLLFFECAEPSSVIGQGEVMVLQTKLIEKTGELERLRKQQSANAAFDQGRLIHTVYFDLKNDITPKEYKAFIAEVKRLSSIKTVQDLMYGNYKEVGDKRAMKHLEVVMQVVFKDKQALDYYQDDKVHLEVKKNVGNYLATAPITYDFVVE